MTSPTSQWTDAELDDSILRLCLEFPDARLAAYSRALEHCRRTTPRGTRESLLTAMRDTLRLDAESQCAISIPNAQPKHPPTATTWKQIRGRKPRRAKRSPKRVR